MPLKHLNNAQFELTHTNDWFYLTARGIATWFNVYISVHYTQFYLTVDHIETDATLIEKSLCGNLRIALETADTLVEAKLNEVAAPRPTTSADTEATRDE